MAGKEFNYMLLARLQNDCEYYLHYGHRNNKSLWAKDERKHIEDMKRLYTSLDIKPLWINMNDIVIYEIKMIERKPNEVFKYNNIKFIAKINNSINCINCCFNRTHVCKLINNKDYSLCQDNKRSDNINIIFKPKGIINKIKYFLYGI